MKTIFQKVFSILFITLLIIGAFSIKRYRLGGFKMSKIMTCPNSFGSLNHSNNANLNELFSNSFSYLGRGTQFYAFASFDQRYVIKILRSDRLTINLIKRLFKSSTISLNLKNKKRKKRVLNACNDAFRKLKKQTGLVYLHLEATTNLDTIKIIDNLGIKREINLNNIAFVIQKKAKLIKQAFQYAKKNNDLTLAKAQVNSFLNLIKIRAKNGIANADPNVFKNFGFIENQAVEIDFGDFYKNSNLLNNKSEYINEINKYVLILREWLQVFWPDLILTFDKQLSSILKNEEISN
jgi:hypothetical protein